VVFQELEVGDQAVLETRVEQVKPLLPNVFAAQKSYPRTIAVHEASFALTTRGNDSAFHIAAMGLEAEPPLSSGGKTRRVWRFHNDTPAKRESDAVEEFLDQPHIEVTTLTDYKALGVLYGGLFEEKSKVSPEISALAAKLTDGITDKKAQAKALYEWVSAHIQYVDIVLGAGGFIPHAAGAVLANGYGDCKDHVMLLEALLAAKNIPSSPVLIRAGINQFQLPTGASPFIFDHLITYIPEFQLFVDSTARYAPFGTLPSMDSGKKVLVVEGGEIMTTPAISAASSSLKADIAITLNADGSADGDTRVQARGSVAIEMRAGIAAMAQDRDAEFFRSYLGPGSDGKIQRNDPEKLGESYDYSAHYHVAHLANVPGPAALPAGIGYKPFSFTRLIGQDLPPGRSLDYACPSGMFEENVTLTLPKGLKVTTLPATRTFTTEGVELTITYKQAKPHIVRIETHLRLARARPYCSAGGYAKARPGLSKMVDALASQILYQ
jgi:hypothetical protein